MISSRLLARSVSPLPGLEDGRLCGRSSTAGLVDCPLCDRSSVLGASWSDGEMRSFFRGIDDGIDDESSSDCELNEFTSCNDKCFQVSKFLFLLVSLSALHERERTVSISFDWACVELEWFSW